MESAEPVLSRARKQNRQLRVDVTPVAQPGERIAKRQLAEAFTFPARLSRLEHRLERARIGLALCRAQRGVLLVELDVLLVRALVQTLRREEPRSFLERLDADRDHPSHRAQLDATVERGFRLEHVALESLRSRGSVEGFAKPLDRT
jgi:hypothetical protein